MTQLRSLGLTCGIGSMLLGSRQAGFEVLGNVEWRKYYHAKDALGRNTFADNFRSAFMVDNLDSLPTDQIEKIMGVELAMGHPECLPGSTNVYTSTGWRPIKDISTGDLVLTHEGRFKGVVRTHVNEMKAGDQFVVIDTKLGPGQSGRLTLTTNHPVMTQRGWLDAGAVTTEDTIKVMAKPCKGCGALTHLHNEFCSVSCAAKNQWEEATQEQRERLTDNAHAVTRQRCKDHMHQFYDPGVRSNAMKALSRARNGSSWIERKMAWALKEVGIDATGQHPIGKYFADFALVGQKIVVECDGVAWHKDKIKEDVRDAALKAEGWFVLHFTEDQIKSDLMGCARQVLRLSLNHAGQYHFMDVQVRSVSRKIIRKRTLVYNLGVADDSSYVAKGFVVHNCGNFSQLNANKDACMNPGDIPLFVDMIAKLKPRFFYMDDLPKSFMAFPMSEYASRLPDYDLFPEWVSNWGYGNVQKARNRMFMVGALRQERFSFKPGEEKHTRTVADVIGDIEGMEGNFPNHDRHVLGEKCAKGLHLKYRDHRATWGEMRDYILNEVKEGGPIHYVGEDGSEKIRVGSYKGHWHGPAHVLTGGISGFHPLKGVPYSIRERARIQGFPDDFVFHGVVMNEASETDPKGWNHDKNMHMVRQTGKAMPIQFNRYAAEQTKAKILGLPFESSGARVITPNSYVSAAKEWYCDNVGYSDQLAACDQCWLFQTCAIRRNKYGIGPGAHTGSPTPTLDQRPHVPTQQALDGSGSGPVVGAGEEVRADVPARASRPATRTRLVGKAAGVPAPVTAIVRPTPSFQEDFSN